MSSNAKSVTTLREVQQARDAWEADNFPNMDAMRALLGVTEEVGEMAHAMLKRDQGIRGTHEEHTEAVKDAAADIVIYLMSVARFEGFDLEQQVIDTWNKVVSKRNWKDNPHDGQTTLPLGGPVPVALGTQTLEYVPGASQLGTTIGFHPHVDLTNVDA
jgi:NTP pyrophosphatase (non-canonical NTP hydrolase)